MFVGRHLLGSDLYSSPSKRCAKRESPQASCQSNSSPPKPHSLMSSVVRVLCKTKREAAVNAELCSHIRQSFPKPAQAGGKPTGPGVSAVSPHTSALERGYSMLHGKLQKGFSDATVKILDSEEAMLPDKLMPWGTRCIYGSLWQKICSQAYNES